MEKATLDPEVAGGMAKLTRRSKPVKVLRRVAALIRVRTQLEGLRSAKGAELPLISRLRDKLLGSATPDLDGQIRVMEAAVAELEADFIEGELTPLTEMEVWQAKAYCTKLHLILAGGMLRGGTEPEQVAADKAGKDTVNLIGTQAWMMKWVGYSLKRKDEKGQLTLYWPDAEVPMDVEAVVLADLFNAYHEAFTPTPAELKKSVAPTTPRRS